MNRATLRKLWVLALLLPLAACGGGSSSGNNNGGGNNGGVPTGANVLPIVSNLGVTNDYANGLFTSVTVCVPGSSNCTTVDNVLVDTGSYGLRLLNTAINGLPLPKSNAPDGNPLGECTQYASTFTWGPVAQADIKLGGETAANVPMQIIGASSFPAAPSDCSSGGLTENDDQASLGANGILGIGVFQYDCGPGCTPPNSTVPPVYFSCPTSGCTSTLVPLTSEVQNPVALFAKDNNGELVQLPSVGATGAPTTQGFIFFGVNTESNNALTGQVVLGADGFGNFGTVFQNQTYNGSILDSGSNANFFLDSQTLNNLPLCTNGNDGFYCPPAPTQPSYTATNVSADGQTTATASWTVANAQDLFNTGNASFNNLAGPNPNAFDFGLSFFFGRTIGIGLNGALVSSQGVTYAGPFYAY